MALFGAIYREGMGRKPNTIDDLVKITDALPLTSDGCKQWPYGLSESCKPHYMLDGKMQYVHRLLYYIKFPEAEKDCQLKQICGNKLCCNIDHIKEGRPYSGRKLSLKDVQTIRKNYPKLSVSQLAKKFKVTSVMIRNILSGKAWPDGE